MAINIKSSTNYLVKLMPLLGVPADLIHQCKEAGVSVSQEELGTFKVLRFGKTFATVAINSTVMQMLNKGVLGKLSKSALAAYFNAGFKAALAESAPATPFEAVASPAIPTALPVQAAPSAAHIGGLMPGKLGQALDCYLPVSGSTTGAVYYVIARYAGLNIAMKTKGGTLSLRAEGDNLDKYLEKLGLLGFKSHGSYASVHFKEPSKALIVKTIGAVVASLGFDHLQKVVNPSKFAEEFCV